MSVTTAVLLVITISTAAIIVSIVVPLILTGRIERVRRLDLVKEYERQDRASRRLTTANEKAAETARTVNDKLDVIHTLVNSNMTSAMQSELDATMRQLALMHEVVELRRADGQAPTSVALDAITDTEAKVAEMRAVLEDRNRAG